MVDLKSESPMRVIASKFTALFVSLLLLLLIGPFVPEGITREIVMGMTLTILIVTSIYAVSNETKHIIIALLLAIPAMASAVLYYTLGDYFIFLACSYIFRLAFFIYTTSLALFYVMKDEDKVTIDTIYGALSIYFLIAITWAHIYSLLELFHPGSFTGAYTDFHSLYDPYSSNFLGDFVYFSFVNLTNLGYGDIAPASLPARSFSMIEAAFGQLYLTVLVARLIGLHIRK